LARAPVNTNAVNRIQQRADVGDIRCPGEHYWQRARDFGHRAKISLSRPAVSRIDLRAIGGSDHPDHRPLIAGFQSHVAISDGSCLPPGPDQYLALRRVPACYFRVNACFGSMAPRAGNPPPEAPFAAGLSEPFHHGNLASIPRVTGSPSGPPNRAARNRSAPLRPKCHEGEIRCLTPLPDHPAAAHARLRDPWVGEGHEHRDQCACQLGTAPVIPAHLLNDTFRRAAL